MESWKKDSENIFKAISSSFENFKEAEHAVVVSYVPDPSFSRAGISDALKRLQEYYTIKSNETSS